MAHRCAERRSASGHSLADHRGLPADFYHPRVTRTPLTGSQAWTVVDNWLSADPVWIPPATERTARVYARLNSRTSITANLVPDAQLAALAVEHGLTVYSADSDFARFPGLSWINPLRTH